MICVKAAENDEPLQINMILRFSSQKKVGVLYHCCIIVLRSFYSVFSCCHHEAVVMPTYWHVPHCPVAPRSIVVVFMSICRNQLLFSSIFLYACESWTLTAELQRRIQAMEMRCYCKMLASYTKTMLPKRNSEDPAGNRTTWRPDHRKETQTAVVRSCLPFIFCKAQWKGEEDEAVRGRGGKTTSGNGQAWSSRSRRGQYRTGKNGGKWLWNHLWCPNDHRG